MIPTALRVAPFASDKLMVQIVLCACVALVCCILGAVFCFDTTLDSKGVHEAVHRALQSPRAAARKHAAKVV
jgi:hypothetical protein